MGIRFKGLRLGTPFKDRMELHPVAMGNPHITPPQVHHIVQTEGNPQTFLFPFGFVSNNLTGPQKQ